VKYCSSSTTAAK